MPWWSWSRHICKGYRAQKKHNTVHLHGMSRWTSASGSWSDPSPRHNSQLGPHLCRYISHDQSVNRHRHTSYRLRSCSLSGERRYQSYVYINVNKIIAHERGDEDGLPLRATETIVKITPRNGVGNTKLESWNTVACIRNALNPLMVCARDTGRPQECWWSTVTHKRGLAFRSQESYPPLPETCP